jgi:hypothetical protein
MGMGIQTAYYSRAVTAKAKVIRKYFPLRSRRL